MNNKKNKKGMAGIITVVLIMALLASVSASYIKLMETENSVTTFTEQHQKAADAAFCGISYAMAKLQTQKNLFKPATSVKNRTYIVSESKYNASSPTLANLSIDKNKLIKSKWNYMDNTNMIIDSDEITDKKPPYMFRVFTYPTKAIYGETDEKDEKESIGSDAYSKIYYMVKSQGLYLEYDDPNSDSREVIATHTAQFIAQLKIDRAQKRVFLYRYKPVPYQADNEFYKYLTKMN